MPDTQQRLDALTERIQANNARLTTMLDTHNSQETSVMTSTTDIAQDARETIEDVEQFLTEHAERVRDTAASTQERMGALLRLRRRVANAAHQTGLRTLHTTSVSADKMATNTRQAYQLFLAEGAPRARKHIAQAIWASTKSGVTRLDKSLGLVNLAIVIGTTKTGRRMVRAAMRPVIRAIQAARRGLRWALKKVGLTGLARKVGPNVSLTKEAPKTESRKLYEQTLEDVGNVLGKRVRDRIVTEQIMKIAIRKGHPMIGMVVALVTCIGIARTLRMLTWPARKVAALVKRLLGKTEAVVHAAAEKVADATQTDVMADYVAQQPAA